MALRKKRIRPIFKKYVKLRENVQDRKKLLKFTRKKWEKLQAYYKKKLKRYNRYKAKDPFRFRTVKHAAMGASLKKKHRDTLQASQQIRLFYGNISKKEEKDNLKYLKKKKLGLSSLTKAYEARLSTLLYRSKFCPSTPNAKQLVTHGVALVNEKKVKSPSYKIREGDVISITKSYKKLINKNLLYAETWPLPPSSIIVNYKTQEILFIGESSYEHHFSFSFQINFERAFLDGLYQ